jgi:hypothetical protein
MRPPVSWRLSSEQPQDDQQDYRADERIDYRGDEAPA